MNYKNLFIFIVSFLAMFWIYWTFGGSHLHYDTYSNDTFWYSKEFSLPAKFFVGLVISVIGGIVAMLIGRYMTKK